MQTPSATRRFGAELDTAELSHWQVRAAAEPSNLAVVDTYVLLLRQEAGVAPSAQSVVRVLEALPAEYKRAPSISPAAVPAEELDFALATVLSCLEADFGLQLDQLAANGANGAALPKLESALRDLLEIRNTIEARRLANAKY